MDPKHIVAFRDHLSAQDIAPKSINLSLSALSSMFKELTFKQIITQNPVLRVKRPKADTKKVKTTFQNKEMRKLLSLYDENKNNQSLQNKALLAFMTLGQRVSTIIKIKIKDIKQVENLYVVTLFIKGGKIKHLPLPGHCSELFILMKERLKKLDDDYLFSQMNTKEPGNKPLHRASIHKLIKRSLKKAELCTSRSAHSFRRFVLTQLLEDGHSTEEVAENVSFHSSLNTLNLYKVGLKKKLQDNPILKRRY